MNKQLGKPSLINYHRIIHQRFLPFVSSSPSSSRAAHELLQTRQILRKTEQKNSNTFDGNSHDESYFKFTIKVIGPQNQNTFKGNVTWHDKLCMCKNDIENLRNN